MCECICNTIKRQHHSHTFHHTHYIADKIKCSNPLIDTMVKFVAFTIYKASSLALGTSYLLESCHHWIEGLFLKHNTTEQNSAFPRIPMDYVLLSLHGSSHQWPSSLPNPKQTDQNRLKTFFVIYFFYGYPGIICPYIVIFQYTSQHPPENCHKKINIFQHQWTTLILYFNNLACIHTESEGF